MARRGDEVEGAEATARIHDLDQLSGAGAFPFDRAGHRRETPSGGDHDLRPWRFEPRLRFRRQATQGGKAQRVGVAGKPRMGDFPSLERQSQGLGDTEALAFMAGNAVDQHPDARFRHEVRNFVIGGASTDCMASRGRKSAVMERFEL